MAKLTKAQQRSREIATVAEVEQEIALLCEMAPVYPGDPTGALMDRVRVLEDARRAALSQPGDGR